MYSCSHTHGPGGAAGQFTTVTVAIAAASPSMLLGTFFDIGLMYRADGSGPAREVLPA